MVVCLYNHITVWDSNPVMLFCFGNFKPKSLMTKFEVMLESWWTLGGLLIESWSPPDGLLVNSWWTLGGLLMDSWLTPGGPVAQCKVLWIGVVVMILCSPFCMVYGHPIPKDVPKILRSGIQYPRNLRKVSGKLQIINQHLWLSETKWDHYCIKKMGENLLMVL